MPRRALAAYREAGVSQVSFVERTTFAVMRARRIDVASAFESDFVAAGFELKG